MDRGLTFAAGLAGAVGIAFAAAAAHVPGGERLGTAGTMAMAQAPALLALGLLRPERGLLFMLAGWAIAIGLAAFAGALAFHTFSGSAALSLLAPIGGTTMIVGWLLICVAAFLRRT